AWTDATVAHFRAKWALGADDPVTASFRPFVTAQRQFPTIDRVQRALDRLLGWRMSRWLGRDVLGRLEIRVNRWWVRVDQARGDHGPIASVVSHGAGLERSRVGLRPDQSPAVPPARQAGDVRH